VSPKKINLIEEDGCLGRVVHLDRGAKARDEAIPERELDHPVLIYKALADSLRLKIVMTLKKGEMCVCFCCVPRP
jgi:hypothetical protein